MEWIDSVEPWFTLAEIVILFVSTLLVLIQIRLLRKQIGQSHEEHRRENTAHVMSSWCTSLLKDSSMAEEIARDLNETQCKALYEHKAFSVYPNTRTKICRFCPLEKSENCPKCSLGDNNKDKMVDGKILNELRYHVINYLNILETVIVTWHLGIVDKETIEEEFNFLCTSGKGRALDTFRRTAGGYPLIESFIKTISKEDSRPRPPLN